MRTSAPIFPSQNFFRWKYLRTIFGHFHFLSNIWSELKTCKRSTYQTKLIICAASISQVPSSDNLKWWYYTKENHLHLKLPGLQSPRSAIAGLPPTTSWSVHFCVCSPLTPWQRILNLSLLRPGLLFLCSPPSMFPKQHRLPPGSTCFEFI